METIRFFRRFRIDGVFVRSNHRVTILSVEMPDKTKKRDRAEERAIDEDAKLVAARWEMDGEVYLIENFTFRAG